MLMTFGIDRRRFLLFPFLLLSMAVGCNSPSSEVVPTEASPRLSSPEITANKYPRVDGSTSTSPLNMLLACELLDVPCKWVQWLEGYMHLAPDVTDFEGDFPNIPTSGTHGAYVSLMEDRSDLILVARLPSQDELNAAAMLGVQLHPEPIAYDAFVFIVNEGNTVESLTITQIQDIYTGKLTNWSEIGGTDSRIHPYQRNPNSGSQELMEKLVMRGKRMVEAPEMVLLKMMAPFYALSDDPEGIGYSVYYFEEYMAGIEKVKLLGVDGIMPNYDTIQSRDYPYVTEVYAVIRGDLDSESKAYQLWAWLQSAGGQEVVAESGYVPILNIEIK